MLSPALLADYERITTDAGLADFTFRTRLEITGADRARVLHNLCTNNIRQLAPGDGCEAFITNVKGKVIGFVDVFCRPDSLVIETAPGQAPALLPHFDKYIITEDAQVHDRTVSWGAWILAGPTAESRLSNVIGAPPQAAFGHATVDIASHPVLVGRVNYVGPQTFLVICEATHHQAIGQTLQLAGATQVATEAIDILRIEAGTPVFGLDISDANLPQEVDRTEKAISFTKGCYLGQETVARLDALGHVNRTLVQVQFFDSAIPPADTRLLAAPGGPEVGAVLSSVWSPRLRSPLAFAYVRQGSNAPGTRLYSTAGDAEVVRLNPPSIS